MTVVRRIAAATALVGCVTAVAIAELDRPPATSEPAPSVRPVTVMPSAPYRPTSLPAFPDDNEIEKWLARLELGPGPRAVLVRGRYLYDGRQKVRLPSGRNVWPFGRVPGGWFIAVSSGLTVSADLGRGRFGVLHMSGSFKEFAEGILQGAALSPDGTRVAMAVIPSGGKPRALVADLRTGTVIGRTPIGPSTRIDGWNPSGIWLSWAPGAAARWIPGQPPQRLRRGPVPASRITDRMVETSEECQKVVALGPRGVSNIADYCFEGGGAGLLSPDGTVFVTPDQVARTIGTGRTVRLEFLPGLPFGDTAWEDTRRVLISVDLEKPVTAHKRTIVRCDITTGDCERAYATNGGIVFSAR